MTLVRAVLVKSIRNAADCINNLIDDSKETQEYNYENTSLRYANID